MYYLPVDTQRSQVSQLVRDDEALAAGLRALPGEEVDLAALAVVGKGRDLDRLGVHHHHGLGGHRELVPVELRQRLVSGGLKALWDVNIAEIGLFTERIRTQPACSK